MDENKVRTEGENTQTSGEGMPDYVGALKNQKQIIDNLTQALEASKKRESDLFSSLETGIFKKQDEEVKLANPQELREKLRKSDDMTNLEFCKTALELRDAVIAQGGVDPFLPSGQKVTFSQQDEEAASRTATILKECIEYADGDSQAFTNELQRRMMDTSPRR